MSATAKLPPDVAILVYDLRASGVSRNALAIADASLAADLSVELWVIRPQGHMQETAPEGVRVVQTPVGRKLPVGRTLDMVLSILPLARYLRRRPPKLLFSAGNHMHMAAGFGFTLAGCSGGTRFLGRASNAVLGTRIGGSGRASLRDRLLRRLDALQYVGMDRIVAVSIELKNQLTELLRVDPARVVVIPNGVDAEVVRRWAPEPVAHPWLEAGEPPVLLGVGRLAPQKNFPLLIRAFAIARRTRPMRLMIMGHGKREAREALMRLAGELEVGADVELLGYQRNPASWLSKVALFVLSSRREGASNVLLEALATGCAVAAVACPTGVREVLDGLGGLSETERPEDLAEAILRSLADPPAREALQRRAADYDRRASLAAFVDFFREELEKPPRDCS